MDIRTVPNPLVRAGGRWLRRINDRHPWSHNDHFHGWAETFAEISRIAREVLPGARIRRRLFFRYTLEWTRPVRWASTQRSGPKLTGLMGRIAG